MIVNELFIIKPVSVHFNFFVCQISALQVVGEIKEPSGPMVSDFTILYCCQKSCNKFQLNRAMGSW